MVYKSFQGSDISHIRYPITKRRTINKDLCSNDQYSYFLTQIDEPSVYILAGLQRYIYNNNAYSQNLDINTLGSIQNRYFPSSMFSTEEGKILLNTSSVATILFIKNINSIDPQSLVSLSHNGNPFYITNSIVYQEQTYDTSVGSFIPDINAILLNKSGYDPALWNVEIQYNFQIHEFEYMCNIQPGQFNRTLNVTAYTSSNTQSQFFMKPELEYTYITAVGLYDDTNTLMAIAKLSNPIRVSNIIDTTMMIGLDYIP